MSKSKLWPLQPINRLLLGLASVYVAAIFFLEGIFGWPAGNVHWADFLFLVLLVVFASRHSRTWLSALPVPVVVALGLYLVANVVSGSWQGGVALTEAAARGYLGIVMLLFALLIQQHPKWLPHLVKVLILAGVVCASYTIICYVMALSTGSKTGGNWHNNYPYLGSLYRAKGPTPSISFLVGLLQLPAFLTWNRCLTKSKRSPYSLAFIVLSAAILLTFSKLILPFLLGLWLLWQWRRKGKFLTRVLITGIVTVVSFGATHWVFSPNQKHYKIENSPHYLGEKTELFGGCIVAFPTNYWATKKAAFRLLEEHLWWGVGPGRFSAHLPTLQTKGLYPTYFNAYDPHCAYTGALTETGIIGALALLLFVFAITRQVYLFWPDFFQQPDLLALVAFVLIIALQGLTTDTMNFRHLWLATGLLIEGMRRMQAHSQQTISRHDLLANAENHS